MNKREFLKTSGALITGALASRFSDGQEQASARTNWAGNYQYHTNNLHTPRTLEDVQRIVKSCDKLKALGARHSFNGIADSTANQISLKQFDDMAIDEKSRTVTVGAGVTYGRMAPFIDAKGFAVHNLASLPHISVAGACATGTHGSGIKNGNLSTAVSGMEIVTADGQVIRVSREKDAQSFPGMVVGLGAIGVVTKVTLDLQPTFQAAQTVYENMSMAPLEKHLDDIFSSGYSVSLFTDWQNHRVSQVWVKQRLQPGASANFPADLFGAKPATRKLHPLSDHSAENCTEQMGIPGPWYERLPHFRMNFTPSSGAELQSEFFVPRERGYEAILAVEQLRDQITPHLFITELRTIDADNLWMSPCYKRPSLAIHFTWKPEWPAVSQLLPKIEEKLAPFDARPHWAKLFTMVPSRLQKLYEKLPDYEALVKKYDPNEKFRNEYLKTNLYS